MAIGNRPVSATFLIGAIEGATFSFAAGCIVQFWALFVQYGCTQYGMPGGGVAMTMYTQVLLMFMETVASFIGASLVEKLRRRKMFVAAAGLMTHGAWFVFGFVVLRSPAGWLLPLAFILLLWRGFFDGMLIAPRFDLAARVVPPANRARFFSVRLFVSSGAVVLGAAAARVIFGMTDVPRLQFAMIFWAGGAVAAIGDIARMRYRESATEVRLERLKTTFRQDLSAMRRLLGGNRSFRLLCLISGLSALTMTVYPHIVPLLAANRLGLSSPDYAALTLVLQISTVISCWYLPKLVARFGWKHTYAVFLAQMVLAISGTGVAALAQPLAGPGAAIGMLAASFVVMGASGAWSYAEANVLYEMSGEEKRPSFLVLLRAVSNSMGIAAALLIAQFGTSQQAANTPYAPMFFAIAAAEAAACLILIFGVHTRAETASR
jgi:MFS family permease